MKLASLNSLLFLFAGIVSAQNLSTGGLEGRVKADDGEVVFVQVQIEGTSMGAVTDDKGYFQINNIPPGSYTLSLVCLGYETHYEQITIENGQTIQVELTLVSDQKLLKEITIVHDQIAAKRREGYALEAIKLIDFQDQSIELGQLLDQMPGIRVRRSGGLGSRMNFSVNGLNGKAIRFFMDGIPMDYFGSAYSINTIPASALERIEVYKGVFPGELGNDALGGAVNLITKASKTNLVEASYSFGSFGTHRASLFTNWVDHKTGLSLQLTSFYNKSDNDYEVWGEDISYTAESGEVIRGIRARRFHDGFESNAVNLRTGITSKSWADALHLGVIRSQMDKDIQHGVTMRVPFGKATYAQAMVMPYLTYQKVNIVSGLDFNAFVGYSDLTRSRVDTSRFIYNWLGEREDMLRSQGGEQARTLNELTEKVLTTRINATYHFGDQLVGLNLVSNNLERTDRDPLLTQINEGYFAPQKFHKLVLGISWQGKWLDQRLSTNAFVKWFGLDSKINDADYSDGRLQYLNLTTKKNQTGAGLAASFDINKKTRTSISLERTARLPDANELLGDGIIIDNNPALNPEQSWNFNIGANSVLLDDTSHVLELSVNAFYRNVTGLIQQSNTDFAGYFIYTNKEKVDIKGIDGSLNWSFRDKFHMSQSVSYLRPIVTTTVDELGNRVTKNKTRLANTPFFQTSTMARYEVGNAFWTKSKAFTALTMNYVGAFYRYPENHGRDNKDVIPSQLVFNLGMGLTLPGEQLTIGLDFNNLLDEQVFDNFAIQKPGRAVYGKITYRISDKRQKNKRIKNLELEQ